MSLISELFKNRIETYASNKLLNEYQKNKRLGAFVNNTLYIIDLIQTKQQNKLKLILNDEFQKNLTGAYTWIPIKQFEKKITDRKLLQESLNFLKQEGLIDVLKKDGKEYYCHWSNEEKGLHLSSKAYKLTDKCKKIFTNTTPEEFDQFIKQIGITELKKYVPATPKDIMNKVEDNFWFCNTKQNIEHVLNNNLELEFHPTTIQNLIDDYNSQRRFECEKELSKEEIQIEISHKLDEYANKNFSYNVRLYSAFTNTPKCWRKYVRTKEGNKVMELFDIHSSVLNILPLVCRINLLKNHCNKETFDQFEQEEKLLESFLTKDVYKLIAADEYTRQDIKNALMKVLFSNNKSFENIANIELTGKGKLKKTAANRIRVWLKNNFPIMFNILANFEEVEVKNSKSAWTKKKSQYWKAFQSIETELMCELNRRVEKKFNIKVYNLHDGCFMDSCNSALYSDIINCNIVDYCYHEFITLKDELKAAINNYYSVPVEQKVHSIHNPLPIKPMQIKTKKFIEVETEPTLDKDALTALIEGTEQFL